METLSGQKEISSYIIHSQEDELKRIALDLHEGVGQNLYSVFNGLQFIESAVQDPAMKEYVAEMSRLMERTIQEIRLLSVELHPPTLSTLGFVPAIKSYIKLYTSTFGVIVDVETEGEEQAISEKGRIAVFRVCQEALANIAKYADTCHVSMAIRWSSDVLTVVIKDFGQGFDLEDSPQTYQSSGLAAMKERMLLAGGNCHISSTIGEGTLIELTLPLD
ncbi:sensor histidine kinase [Neobacillus notoginsengisoli]|uniref:histidine kinase n=1 Tax=Neobacillus notoginsengisoli TaxID=1578198 RepID=A0A417YVT2_9BACI|nr:ATP-binding protein [Neobacillus notoginsengisoli]RHW41509.1 sensor histidine kinase [Neobacillus notoginsengisoli]